jgi:hypothetical protein
MGQITMNYENRSPLPRSSPILLGTGQKLLGWIDRLHYLSCSEILWLESYLC